MIKTLKKNKVFFIAEAGVNHNGNINIALKMIDLAKKAGADCIKFQAFSIESLVSREAKSAEYQKINVGTDLQWKLLKKLQLSKTDFKRLAKECEKKKIEFLCTAFDEQWLEFLISIGMLRIKIPSGEINNFPLLKKAASYGVEIILSTGMSTLNEIKKSLNIIKSINSNIEVVLLHCTSLYPAPYDSLNLNAIKVMKSKFKNAIGYSDHSLGNLASISAIAMGAVIIEKHFTLNKKQKGPDHKASANYTDLKKLISDIRNLESALGSGEKIPDIRELSIAEIARKSWHAKKKIFKNNIIKKKDIHLIRPGTGIPGNLDIIGKKTKVDIASGSMIKKDWLL
jgi:N-acetylneuraminate synthase